MVGGARGDGLTFRQDAAAYDPSSDTWRPVPVPPLGITAEMPASRSGRFVNASLHRVGDRVVVFAEESAPNWAEERGVMTAASWDTVTDDWTLLEEPGLKPGPYAATVVGRDLVVTTIDEAALGAAGEDPRPPRGLPATRRLDGDTGGVDGPPRAAAPRRRDGRPAVVRRAGPRGDGRARGGRWRARGRPGPGGQRVDGAPRLAQPPAPRLRRRPHRRRAPRLGRSRRHVRRPRPRRRLRPPPRAGRWRGSLP